MGQAALDAHDVTLVRADNPSLFTLEGTNSWLCGRDPCWVVDPGPALDAHVEAVVAAGEERGGIGGIALTHAHGDHSDAIGALRARVGDVTIAAAAFSAADRVVAEGDAVGPLHVVALPGHAPDHLAFVAGPVAFVGDAVLGTGSVFVAPDPGALTGYLTGLRRLRAEPLELLCPGHGPVVTDPQAKLDEYVAHRLDRERRLLIALAEDLRSVDDLLDRAWPDVPDELRPAAAVTLAAHLDKLEEEGRLPEGVERPAWPPEGSIVPEV